MKLIHPEKTPRSPLIVTYGLKAGSGEELACNGRKYAARACEFLARQTAILVHSLHEVSDGIEFKLRPDPADECGGDLFAIKIAGEIKKINLEQRRALAEGRTPAEACHPVMNRALGEHAHGVNALRKRAGRVEGD